MQNYNEYYELTKSVFFNQGGIGNIYITKNNDINYIYKLTYSASAFINNILTYNKLNKIIPCSKLINYYIINNDNKLLYNFKNSLKSLSLKNKFIEDYIYVLKYSLYDYNTFGYYSTILYNNLVKELPYMIIWTFICIYKINNINIFHNDLKIDNILMKKKINNIVIIDNIIIGNKTNYEYVLNDFDMSFNKNIFDDINTFKNSIYRMFNKRLLNNNNLLDNINNINDIYERILLNPSNYTREMLSIDIF